MAEFLDNLMQKIPLGTAQLYTVLGVLAGVLALAFLFRKQIGNWREERQVARTIRRLGARSLRNLQLPDGMGGEVTIDHLLLTRDGLLVVGVKRYSGLIFGGPQTDQWTQVINRVSYKFTNPDVYLHRQINAVRILAPGATVTGLHLFTHGAQFPKDKPGNVRSTREINRLPKRPTFRDIPKALRTAWKELVDSINSKQA